MASSRNLSTDVKSPAVAELRAILQYHPGGGLHPGGFSVSYYSTVFRSFIVGILYGINAMLLLIIIVTTNKRIEQHNQVHEVVSFLYFNLSLPILLANLMNFAIFVWDSYRVNYRVVFEVQQKLYWADFAAMIAVWTLCYESFVLGSLLGVFDHIISLAYQPWIILALMSLYAVAGLPHQYYLHQGDYLSFQSSRWWLVRVLWRVAITPYYTCRFADFFIADLLSSMTPAFQAFGLLIEISQDGVTDAYSDGGTNISINFPVVWYILFLQVLPAYARCWQCLRRYYDAKGGHFSALWSANSSANSTAYLHLVNFSRYALFIISSIFYSKAILSDHPSLDIFYAAVVLRLIYSTFSFIWDVVMDFGINSTAIFHPSAALPIGKDSGIGRVYPWYFHLFLVIFDVIARFLWLLFVDFQTANIYLSYTVVLLPVVEVVRRWLWTLVRVEIEHVANCQKGKVSADVVLPFATDDLYG